MVNGGGRRAATQARIEEDIRREKAAALGRAGERLDAALADLRDLVHRLEQVVDLVIRRCLFDEYERARRRAELARDALVIQREAIGLRHHAAVDELFPAPPLRRRTD